MKDTADQKAEIVVHFDRIDIKSAHIAFLEKKNTCTIAYDLWYISGDLKERIAQTLTVPLSKYESLDEGKLERLVMEYMMENIHE